MEELNYENEEWRSIKGYEGRYEVSNYGRVRSLNYHRKGKCRIMKLSAGWNRYIKASLVDKDGNSHTYRVHRLVAQAFLPEPSEEQTQVNHINGNKQDNYLLFDDGQGGQHVNLEWTTPKENVNNPVTKYKCRIRYHREGEHERRSAGQRKRFREHPEDLQKMWDGYRRYQQKRREKNGQFGFS